MLRLSRAGQGRLLDYTIAILLTVAVMSAMVFTSRTFATDWKNNLWLVVQQARNIRALGHPSYFVTSSLGVFQPWFVFYGGTAYTGTALLALLLGDHPAVAYIMSFGIAVAVAYASCWWLAVQIGLRGWAPRVPGLLFVTSSYYVTNIYGRADFPEVISTSMIPLVAASGFWLLRAQRWRPMPLLTFMIGVLFLTGSHPETFVWGDTFLVAVGVIVLLAVRGRMRPRVHRIGAVLGVAALATLLDAWSLLPTLAYDNRLLVASPTSLTLSQFGYTAPDAVFAVMRNAVTSFPITANIQAQLPTLAIVWGVVTVVVLRRRYSSATLRIAIGVGELFLLFAVLSMLGGSLSSVLPWPWRNIQFPYRLVTYGTLAGCLLVGVALVAVRQSPMRTRRVLSAGLAVACLISLGAAMKQIWTTPSFPTTNRTRALGKPGVAPNTFYPGVVYTDISAPVVTPSISQIKVGNRARPERAIDFPFNPIAGTISETVKVPKRGTVATNIATGPYMVKLTGAVPAGRTALRPGGQLGNTFMVVRLKGRPGSLDRITVSTASSPALTAGLWVSEAAALLAMLLLIATWGANHSVSDANWVRMIGRPV